MKPFSTLEDAILYSINSATECADFFNNFSAGARNAIVRKQFMHYSRNEYSQISKLNLVLREKSTLVNLEFNTSISAERIENAQCKGKTNLGYLQTLIMAMRRSQLAKTLFTELAAQFPDKEAHDIFISLAQKEIHQLSGIANEYNDSLLVFS